MEISNFIRVVLFLVLCVDLTVQESLSDVIKGRPELSKFTEYINKADATGEFQWVVNVDGASTCFAPVNDAWNLIPPVTDDLLTALLNSHFSNDRKTWSSFEDDKKVNLINQTTMGSLGNKKQLLFHEEHDDYFVSGARFVTKEFTSPAENSIVAGPKVLFLIDRVITGLAHPDNFYDHMNTEETRASEFAKLVDHYGTAAGTEGRALISKLQTTRGTIFVPKASILSNPLMQAELTELKKDLPKLGKILKSHVIEGNFIFTRYFHEEVPWTTLGDPIIAHAANQSLHPGVDRLLEGGGVMAEVRAGEDNITMSNGVMHFTDALLYFKLKAYTIIGTNKVVDATGPSSSQAVGDLYVRAVRKVPSVMNTLNSATETITVFAPAHLATEQSQHFKRLIDEFDDAGTDLEKDQSELAKILNAAIVRESINLDRLRQGVNVQNVNGTTLKSMVIAKDVYVEVDGIRARILETNANIEASNGYVHVIDKVLGLKGTNILEKLTKTNFANQLTTFNQLLQSTGLSAVLADPNQELTVFAPVDGAFEITKRQFEGQSPSFEQFLSEDKYSAGRKVFVQRHIVQNKTKITAMSNDMILTPINDNEQIRVFRVGDGSGMMQVQYKSVGGSLMSPLPAGEADNGYFYRLRGGCLYSMEDPKVGKVGQSASAISVSIVLTLLCAVLATLY